MGESNLKTSIEALRAEVRHIETSHPASKERLEHLLLEIEHASQSGTESGGLGAKLREAVLHLEAEHPKVTAILNDVLVSLGNVGM